MNASATDQDILLYSHSPGHVLRTNLHDGARLASRHARLPGPTTTGPPYRSPELRWGQGETPLFPPSSFRRIVEDLCDPGGEACIEIPKLESRLLLSYGATSCTSAILALALNRQKLQSHPSPRISLHGLPNMTGS
jgi:hypothetical protein